MHSIRLIIVSIKMMRILLSMSEELNINNVLNVNFGLKEMMVAAQ